MTEQFPAGHDAPMNLYQEAAALNAAENARVAAEQAKTPEQLMADIGSIGEGFGDRLRKELRVPDTSGDSSRAAWVDIPESAAEDTNQPKGDGIDLEPYKEGSTLTAGEAQRLNSLFRRNYLEHLKDNPGNATDKTTVPNVADSVPFISPEAEPTDYWRPAVDLTRLAEYKSGPQTEEDARLLREEGAIGTVIADSGEINLPPSVPERVDDPTEEGYKEWVQYQRGFNTWLRDTGRDEIPEDRTGFARDLRKWKNEFDNVWWESYQRDPRATGETWTLDPNSRGD